MPVVICELDAGEQIVTERGSMVWMSYNMKMETKGTSLGKAFGRIFSGESIFQNVYTAQGGPGTIAFAPSFMGSIRAIQITPDRPVICQKAAFLAATTGVQLSTHVQRKFGAGLVGGEGFIMQKLSGNGLAFVELDGSAVEYELAPGQKLVVDTGNLAIADASIQIDVETVKGVKNVLFGGESLFNTVVTGPGAVTVQTMPISNLVGEIAARIPSK
jgi:uncharacterized protein (AIM24 family)